MVSSTYVPDVKRSITSFYRFLVQRYNEKLDCPTFHAIIPDLYFPIVIEPRARIHNCSATLFYNIHRAIQYSRYETLEKNHARIEKRTWYYIACLGGFRRRIYSQWQESFSHQPKYARKVRSSHCLSIQRQTIFTKELYSKLL